MLDEKDFISIPKRSYGFELIMFLHGHYCISLKIIIGIVLFKFASLLEKLETMGNFSQFFCLKMPRIKIQFVCNFAFKILLFIANFSDFTGPSLGATEVSS